MVVVVVTVVMVVVLVMVVSSLMLLFFCFPPTYRYSPPTTPPCLPPPPRPVLLALLLVLVAAAASGLRRAVGGVQKGEPGSPPRAGGARGESVQQEPQAGGADVGGVPGATVSPSVRYSPPMVYTAALLHVFKLQKFVMCWYSKKKEMHFVLYNAFFSSVQASGGGGESAVVACYRFGFPGAIMAFLHLGRKITTSTTTLTTVDHGSDDVSAKSPAFPLVLVKPILSPKV